MEDTGIPVIYRNAQALTIWEGTTNVLSLDMVRAIKKENGFAAFSENVKQRLHFIKDVQGDLKAEWEGISNKLSALTTEVAGAKSAEEVETGARAFAFDVATLYSRLILLEFTNATRSEKGLRWLKFASASFC
jgi:putative acyl-CoA dehydrogenase